MKLTPTRVSILALSAFSALIAREFLRSDVTPSNAAPPNPASKRPLFTQPLVSSVPPLAQPESIAPINALHNSGNVPVPSFNPVVKAPQLPTPPQFLTPIAPINVNALPLDAIVADSIGSTLSPVQPKALPSAREKPPAQAAFQDLQGHRAQNSIKALMQRGIMQGFTDGTFRPDARISDAQFKAVLKKAAQKLPSIASLNRPSDIVTRADAAIYVHRQLLRATAIAADRNATNAPQSALLPALASTSIVSTPMPPSSASSAPLPPPPAQTVPENSLPAVASAIRNAANPQPYTSNASNRAQAINVAIAGEVGKPGTYALTIDKTAPTLTTLIREAGGMKPLANLQNVIVRRLSPNSAPQTINVNLWKLLSEGDRSQDVTLQPGDSVEVPTAQAVSAGGLNEKAASFLPDKMMINVVGNVPKPGLLEVPLHTSLDSALKAAGGLSETEGTIEVIRVNANGITTRREVPFELARSLNQDDALQHGDVVVVRTSQTKSGAKPKAAQSPASSQFLFER